jgi:hypothetical protein
MSNLWKSYRVLLGLALALILANPPGVKAQQTACCCKHFCCPHNSFCQEGPPRICFKCGCPLPTVNPCTQPNWGYYQNCWTPWPWPPDWSHCPVPPPASVVFPPPGPQVSDMLLPRLPEPSTLPRPRPIER